MMRLAIDIQKWHLTFSLIKVPATPIQGITSNCIDGLHCLFLDYDEINPERVYLDVKRLLELGAISHAYLFKTHEKQDSLGIAGNYHVISLDKFYYKEILDLQALTHCDDQFRKLAQITRYRAWVLRYSKKGDRPAPEFIRFVTLKKPTVHRQQSQAHHILLSKLYGKLQDEQFPFAFDGLTETPITTYNTNSKVELQ